MRPIKNPVDKEVPRLPQLSSLLSFDRRLGLSLCLIICRRNKDIQQKCCRNESTSRGKEYWTWHKKGNIGFPPLHLHREGSTQHFFWARKLWGQSHSIKDHEEPTEDWMDQFLYKKMGWQVKRSTETTLLGEWTRKSAKLWVVAILNKMMIILWNLLWNLWQSWNQVLHLPIGSLTVVSHYSLNFWISKEAARGKNDISKFNYSLFSVFHMVIIPHARVIVYQAFYL